MGAASAGSLVLGLVEAEGAGLKAVGLCGPVAATRLACSSKSWSLALPSAAVRAACTGLSPTGAAGGAALLNAEELAAAVPQEMRPDRRVLRSLCRLTAGGPAGVAALDEVFILLAQGLDPGPAALWARALHREGVARLLENAPVALMLGRAAASAQAPPPPSSDDFFEAVLDANLPATIRCLAAGLPLDAEGPRMLGEDPGCCRWSLLAAAAQASSRRGNGHVVVAFLLAARAEASAPCPGPCGWTPLMRAAKAGAAAAEACRLLVMAGADVRQRNAEGNTALDLGDKAAARAIRDARDLRATATAAVQGQGPAAPVCAASYPELRGPHKEGTDLTAAGSGGRHRTLPPHAKAALAHAAGRSGKGSRGRGT